jgi:multidrug efflux pump subunit AcrA (membrane-fusion protein)
MPVEKIERAIMQKELETNQLVEEPQHVTPQVTPPPELPAAPPRTALIIVGLVVVVLAVSGAASMFSRVRAGHALAKETEVDSVPTVAVVHPMAEKPDEELVLPASLQAYEESPIYARTNGYLLRWYKDIGSKVNKGELLADIDTPEVDQELSQARATRPANCSPARYR